MNNPKYRVIEKEGLVTLIPTTEKIQQTLLFLHGWGQSGPEWIDYFIQGTATPEVNKALLFKVPMTMILGNKNCPPNCPKKVY